VTSRVLSLHPLASLTRPRPEFALGSRQLSRPSRPPTFTAHSCRAQMPVAVFLKPTPTLRNGPYAGARVPSPLSLAPRHMPAALTPLSLPVKNGIVPHCFSVARGRTSGPHANDASIGLQAPTSWTQALPITVFVCAMKAKKPSNPPKNNSEDGDVSDHQRVSPSPLPPAGRASPHRSSRRRSWLASG